MRIHPFLVYLFSLLTLATATYTKKRTTDHFFLMQHSSAHHPKNLKVLDQVGEGLVKREKRRERLSRRFAVKSKRRRDYLKTQSEAQTAAAVMTLQQISLPSHSYPFIQQKNASCDERPTIKSPEALSYYLCREWHYYGG